MSAVLAAVFITFSLFMPAEAYAQESSPVAGQEKEVSDGADTGIEEDAGSADSAGAAAETEEADPSGNTGAGAEAEEQTDRGSSDGNAGTGEEAVSGENEDTGEDADAEEQAVSKEAGSSGENEETGTQSDPDLEEETDSSDTSGEPVLGSTPPDAADTSKGSVSYDYNATLCDPESGNYPGVYETALTPNSASEKDAPTIGMPSIADGNLDKPTTESPAIIQGAAVGYEEKTGPVDYKKLKDRVDPYTEFKVNVVEEKAQDGTVHKKLTGFDGTYVIVRLDVSEFCSKDEET